MITRPSANTLIKVATFLVWIACLIFVIVIFRAQGIPMRHVPGVIKGAVLDAGFWGPFLVVGLYLVSTLFVVAKGTLDVIVGHVYGPLVGGVIVLIGLNASAVLSFIMGRYFGSKVVTKYETGWVKTYNHLLRKEGFVTVLLMRLLMLPFDVVSVVCGASLVTFRQYFWATFLGSIPVTMTLVFFGGALDRPRGRLVLAAVYVLALLIALFARRCLSSDTYCT
ncbi:MAG: VTT domain-containing protein, partial [bacterium]|nr:VTT domain-containing protein [bacterium]